MRGGRVGGVSAGEDVLGLAMSCRGTNRTTAVGAAGNASGIATACRSDVVWVKQVAGVIGISSLPDGIPSSQP